MQDESAYEMHAKEQKRVCLWAVPRSVSSAFCCAMKGHGNIKILYEPFSYAYYFGEERISSRYSSDPPITHTCFKDIKAKCEEPYAEYDAVFVKDLAYYLTGKLTDMQYLPTGYIHTFLIRDPRKTISSMYKMSMNTPLTGWDYFEPMEARFKELMQVYQLVTSELGQEAIIIDSDDLVKDPRDILQKYCRRTGLQYSDDMLKWECDEELESMFLGWEPWVLNAMNSGQFKASSANAKVKEELDELPPEAQECINESIPIYEKMYAERLR